MQDFLNLLAAPVVMAAVFIVVVLYTAVGGFISVVKTDAVQGIVMSIAAILLFWGTLNSAGGLEAIDITIP